MAYRGRKKFSFSKRSKGRRGGRKRIASYRSSRGGIRF